MVAQISQLFRLFKLFKKTWRKKNTLSRLFLKPKTNIKIISKKRLSEQGSRFLNKKKNNILL